MISAAGEKNCSFVLPKGRETFAKRSKSAKMAPGGAKKFHPKTGFDR